MSSNASCRNSRRGSARAPDPALASQFTSNGLIGNLERFLLVRLKRAAFWQRIFEKLTRNPCSALDEFIGVCGVLSTVVLFVVMF